MAKLILAATAYILGILAAHAQATAERSNTPFSKIEVSGNVEVVLSESESYSIIVESQEQATLHTVKTTVKNGTLKISRAQSGLPARVVLTGRDITRIRLRSNAELRILNELNARKMEVIIDDKSYFHGSLAVDKLYLSASRESQLNVKAQSHQLFGQFNEKAKANISGYASSARFTTDSGALCNARNFTSNGVSIKADNLSGVLIRGIGEMRPDTTGEAKVTYFGTPEKLVIESASNAIAKKALSNADGNAKGITVGN